MLQNLLQRIESSMPLSTAHKGLYLSVLDADGKEKQCKGFMSEGLSDLSDSLNKIYQDISFIETDKVIIDVILSVDYLQDPLQWDNEKDGVFFMWGGNKAFLLPRQVRELGLKQKTDILDRLCCWYAGVPSNLWKNQCGLIFAVKSIEI